MVTFVVFILILSVLVMIHEFGHFYAAKKSGVFVEEFGFGLPPKIFGKKYGETIYSFNLLPFGGFVKLLGEEDLESSKDTRNFMHKHPLQRAFILVAGVLMNVALALFLYYVFFFINGFKSLNVPVFFDYQFKYGNPVYTNTVVTSYAPDSPAELAGIKRGEAIVKINDEFVNSVDDVRRVVNDSKETLIKITLQDVRSPTVKSRDVLLRPMEEDGVKLLGVLLTPSVQLDYTNGKVLSAPKHAYNMLAYSLTTFKRVLGFSVETRDVGPVSNSVSGPIGIFSVVDNILEYKGRAAVLGIIDLIALLSLSLALLNILPFPALDGGRLLFVLIEFILGGRRVPSYIEASLHKWGMLFLLLLIVLVTYKDIVTFF
ncbi:MAG: site-2 protease family protein [Patescibacteria group bacterium]|uniref:Site-2 protease family protein n=1 Tax=candidate division WWE3 bacterium TaxID=2053526 RepID=A0A955J213_UNCKA|nr:site-2 protease family protein [candidate division WWE3 bacterium]